MLRAVVDALGVPVVVHCCADRPPVGLLHAAGAAGLSLDLTAVDEHCDDELGAAVEDGVTLFAGVVPAVPVRDVAAVGRRRLPSSPVRRLWRRLGLPPEGLRRVVVTPTCGMAGADPAHVLAALRLARAAAGQLADDPEA